MTDQLALLPAEVKLTDRHRYALDAIQQAGGLTAEDLGARMHDRRGKHPADRQCSWCFDEGKSVASELQRKKLIVRRRATGRYESLRSLPDTSVGQTGEIPY